MIHKKIYLPILFLAFGLHAMGGVKSRSNTARNYKYVDIDKIPKANIEYSPVFQEETPTLYKNEDTLKYRKNIFSVLKWLGTANEPLGNFDEYGFALYSGDKPVFKKDSVFMHSPVQVSNDSTKFTYTLLNGMDGEETPYGAIFYTDVKTKKTITIRGFKLVNGPFLNNGRSFIFAKGHTICEYDIASRREKDLLHIVSENAFDILGLKVLDDGKTIRILFPNDEATDHTCTALDVPIGTMLRTVEK